VKKIEAEEGKMKTIQLNNGEVAPICNLENKGMLYFNSQSNDFWGCNGTEWKRMQFIEGK